MLPVLGATLAQLAVYEAILLPVVLFHHSNIRLPRAIDFGLLAVVVTPAMHRVHHSRNRPETNSNYGFNLAWWDRLFRTYRGQPAAGHHDMQIGLRHLADAPTSSLAWLLALPFKRLGARST